MSERKEPDERDKPLADRRAEADAPQENDPDIGGEDEPSATDPPNAPADAPGGEQEGWRPHTEAP